MQAKTLPGFRDFYPEEAALRQQIFEAWRSVADRYGFEEYDGPPLEALELYTQKSGQEIVEQLYNFQDKGGREVALRPEMTPTLARMVAARAQALKKPIRWYSLPQLFRYERQQRGRLREHFQLNVDVIGEPGPLADTEVIAVAIDIMRALGLDHRDVRVRISDRRVIRALLDAVGVSDVQLDGAYAAIDKLERESRDKLAARLVEQGMGADTAERVLEIGSVRGWEAAKGAIDEHGVDAAVARDFSQCLEALDAMGLGAFIDVDLSIVRGLAYYTGTVFELFDAGRSLRAICGGGRYDNLLNALGGVDLPAVGFGMGDVVLGELMRDRGWRAADRRRLDAFIVGVTAEDLPEVLRLSHALRDRGVRTEFSLKTQSVAKQLKLAAARPARRAVIVGPDERESGAAVVRDLESGTEQRVSLSTIVSDQSWL
jgi:histidyl-tRNA synthetase